MVLNLSTLWLWKLNSQFHPISKSLPWFCRPLASLISAFPSAPSAWRRHPIGESAQGFKPITANRYHESPAKSEWEALKCPAVNMLEQLFEQLHLHQTDQYRCYVVLQLLCWLSLRQCEDGVTTALDFRSISIAACSSCSNKWDSINGSNYIKLRHSSPAKSSVTMLRCSCFDRPILRLLVRVLVPLEILIVQSVFIGFFLCQSNCESELLTFSSTTIKQCEDGFKYGRDNQDENINENITSI